MFSLRYLWGLPAATVDDKVYLDFTNPRLQRHMNNLILDVFHTMGFFKEEIE